MRYIQQFDNYQCVTIKTKVVSVEKEEEVNNGLTKQDCVIADALGTAKIVLWENINTLGEDQGYQLSGVMIWSFKGSKYLSVPKNNFDVEPIDDIGDNPFQTSSSFNTPIGLLSLTSACPQCSAFH